MSVTATALPNGLDVEADPVPQLEAVWMKIVAKDLPADEKNERRIEVINQCKELARGASKGAAEIYDWAFERAGQIQEKEKLRRDIIEHELATAISRKNNPDLEVISILKTAKNHVGLLPYAECEKMRTVIQASIETLERQSSRPATQSVPHASPQPQA